MFVVAVGMLLGLCLFAACWCRVGCVFFVVNRQSSELSLAKGKLIVASGEFKELQKQPKGVKVLSNGVETPLKMATGTAGKIIGVVADEQGIRAVDTNDVQVALSHAAMDCPKADWDCVGKGVFGGVPSDFAKRAFTQTWMYWHHWEVCNKQAPAVALRTTATRTGHQLETLREFPLVAAVRSFVTKEECKTLVAKAALRDLTMAHVGSGGGGTSTSDARETLTTSLWVNWEQEDTLSAVAGRTFDLASDLVDADVPYEGQEPINFLHYVKGFEYRPHSDGRTHPRNGNRIATTLIYCEAPDEGGATIFTNGSPLRFQPTPGDILFFAYNPDPKNEAMHAACPVIAGNKTTLTQWHRLGVSSTYNWDNYEDWGKFHNPFQKTVWKGPRFSVRGSSEL